MVRSYLIQQVFDTKRARKGDDGPDAERLAKVEVQWSQVCRSCYRHAKVTNMRQIDRMMLRAIDESR